ncbi:MAG: penicillin-binding transpeptidase domain-containing protein, partial [Actinomycetota bacterium]|nr:penicillin-binding transpeptidase domain-containing protein [Actinomycetota bacterium]
MSEISDSTHARIKALAAFAIIVPAVLLARLWLLQGAWGNDYKAMAEENRIRHIAIAAPRGEILARGGEPLVKNRLTVTLTLSPQRAHDKKLVARLSKLLGMSVREIYKQVRSVKINPIEPRVIKRDVSKEVMAYIEEHDADFVGVELKVEAIRDYPNGGLAAHIVGYLGELSELEQKERAYSGYALGDLVGKSGIERQYENVLSGSKGTEYVEVNAANRPIEVIDKKEPDPGNNVVLTIDKRIQASAEAALAATMAAAKKTKSPRASAGAIVVTTPTGEVVAMASWPTYDPRIFVGGVSTAQWATLTDKKSEYPLSNRAIMSGYPAGSTFKV